MDKRTRVFNAMDLKPVDHVPVGFWYHFSPEQSKGQASIQAHLDYIRDVDTDLLKVMSDGYFPYPVPTILKAADWLRMKPLPEDHPYFTEQVERAKGIVDAIGKEIPVFYNVFAPFSSIRFGAGEEKVMADLKEDKKAVMHALDVIAHDNALLCEKLIKEAGCDGVYFCVQGGEYGRFTPEEYAEMITPSELYVLERANACSEHNIMHCCGWAGDKNQMILWKNYPVKCINWAVWVEEMPLGEGRDFFGGRAVLGGYETLHREGGLMNTGVLHEGTKEEVVQYTKGLIQGFGKKGLLLGGDCTIDSRIDHERIRWVVETARSM